MTWSDTMRYCCPSLFCDGADESNRVRLFYLEIEVREFRRRAGADRDNIGLAQA